MKKTDIKVGTDEIRTVFKDLIRWIGDNPSRPSLSDTPRRAAKAYQDLFSGYQASLDELFVNSLFASGGYNNMIVFDDIDFLSYCEHHFLPMSGKISLAYIPNDSILGVGKIVELVDVFAKRLQIQERMTIEIAETFAEYVHPKGVIVLIKAEHECMAFDIKKRGLKMQTMHAVGVFAEQKFQDQFFSRIII